MTIVAAGGAPELRRDRPLLLLLALVVLLQLVSWWQLDGYQLADSVEFMERARAHAAGEQPPAEGMVRSFGFSALLVPFFWLADVLSLRDPRIVLVAIRMLQMVLGLALVVACARIGERLAGRTAGLATAFAVGVNPVFLQYSVSPVSGVAASLCMALGVVALLRPGPRRGFFGGLALGVGLLMAYQTLLVAVPFLVLVALRNRREDLRQTGAMFLGYAVGVLAQVGLDKYVYGEWGITLTNYLLENASSLIARNLNAIGFSELARTVYERGHAITALVDGEARQLQPRLYYLQELGRMLVAPIAAFTAIGLFLVVRRPRWSTTLLTLTLLINVAVMSTKGAKSFRLWLPLIPLLAPLTGIGVAWLMGVAGSRGLVLRRVGVFVALAASVVLGVVTLREVNTKKFGVYWQAIEHVNAHTIQLSGPDTPTPLRPRVASAYHWAVFLREAPEVELVKLPQHLDHWKRLLPEARAATLAVLDSVEWLLVHRPILDQEADLFDHVAARFEVVAGFWTFDTDADLGPVLVLRRAGHDSAGKPLVRTARGVDLVAWRNEHGLARHLLEPLAFLEPPATGGAPTALGQPPTVPDATVRSLVYLGWRWMPLAGTGLGWIEHHWWTDTGLREDWTVVDRITDPTGRNAWQNDHVPGYGFRPTSAFEPGTLLVEGYPLLAGCEPFTPKFKPLGGPWRRADLVPASMWLKLARFDEDGREVARMLPAQRDGRTPVDLTRAEELGDDVLRSEEGLVFAPDRLVLVGPFFLPVHPWFRWPDDGRPDPE